VVVALGEKKALRQNRAGSQGQRSAAGDARRFPGEPASDATAPRNFPFTVRRTTPAVSPHRRPQVPAAGHVPAALHDWPAHAVAGTPSLEIFTQ